MWALGWIRAVHGSDVVFLFPQPPALGESIDTISALEIPCVVEPGLQVDSRVRYEARGQWSSSAFAVSKLWPAQVQEIAGIEQAVEPDLNGDWHRRADEAFEGLQIKDWIEDVRGIGSVFPESDPSNAHLVVEVAFPTGEMVQWADDHADIAILDVYIDRAPDGVE